MTDEEFAKARAIEDRNASRDESFDRERRNAWVGFLTGRIRAGYAFSVGDADAALAEFDKRFKK